MSFELEQIVPWGRSLDEYIAMFSLTDADLEKIIIGCADGPASFNIELTERGGRVVSIDPIYRYNSTEISDRIQDVAPIIYEQLKASKSDFSWDCFKSPQALVSERLRMMNLFLEDFKTGKQQGRYIEAILPELPFENSSFDLTLCSHFLFLYSDHLSLEFHRDSILELLRISAEVRIFPLVELDGTRTRYLDRIVDFLKGAGHACSVENVDYEFQIGGNKMLRITRGLNEFRKLS